MYADIWAFIDDVTSSLGEMTSTKYSNWSDSFPPLDVSVDIEKGDLFMRFALAGYSKEELDIKLEGDTIKVTGKGWGNFSKKRHIRSGIKKTDFSSKYVLPSGKYNLAEAKATFEEGILEIVIPPASNHKPRNLLIK